MRVPSKVEAMPRLKQVEKVPPYLSGVLAGSAPALLSSQSRVGNILDNNKLKTLKQKEQRTRNASAFWSRSSSLSLIRFVDVPVAHSWWLRVSIQSTLLNSLLAADLHVEDLKQLLLVVRVDFWLFKEDEVGMRLDVVI